MRAMVAEIIQFKSLIMLIHVYLFICVINVAMVIGVINEWMEVNAYAARIYWTEKDREVLILHDNEQTAGLN